MLAIVSLIISCENKDMVAPTSQNLQTKNQQNTLRKEPSDVPTNSNQEKIVLKQNGLIDLDKSLVYPMPKNFRYQLYRNDGYVLPEEAMKSVNRGVGHVFQYIPDTPDQITYEMYKIHHPLLVSLKNYHEGVRWSKLEQDGAIRSIERGKSYKGFFTIVPPTHPSFGQLPASLAMEKKPNRVGVLMIKPIMISDAWMGILIAHEMIHLMDYTSGIEARNVSRKDYLNGEARAYTLELILIDLMTQGVFKRVIENSCKEHGFNSIASFQALVADKKVSKNMLESIDKKMPFEEPLSNRETGNRYGLYLVAIAFEIAFKADDYEGTLLELLKILWSDDSKTYKELPKH